MLPVFQASEIRRLLISGLIACHVINSLEIKYSEIPLKPNNFRLVFENGP